MGNLKICTFFVLFFVGCYNKSFKSDECEKQIGCIDGVRLVTYAKSGMSFESKSEKGKIDDKNCIILWNVNINIYEKNVTKATINADIANVSSNRNNIEFKNNVEVSINDNRGKKVKLYTNSLNYIGGKLISKDRVRVEYPDKILEGTGVSISSDFSDIVVYGSKLVVER